MVMKKTSSFVCKECGYDSPQWLGKCPECGNWSTFKEIKISSGAHNRKGDSERIDYSNLQPKTFSEITSTEKKRINSTFGEMNTVLGGGIVLGSVTLLAGDPGVGKSTLLLQVALSIA